MKIVHVESGLGNQMLNYAEYLAIKSKYDDVCIENLIYETKPDGKGISQWNGYELKRVFDLDLPNLSNYVDENIYEYVKEKLIESKYWDNSWKYAEPICEALNQKGYNVKNLCIHGTEGDKVQYTGIKKHIKSFFFETSLGNFIYRNLCKILKNKLIRDNYENQYIECDDDFYCGQSLKFMFKGHNIEKIENQLRKDFEFKNVSEKNQVFVKEHMDIQTVAIHTRRGDFLSRNSFCYKYGYFKRAVKFIKKKINNPTFIFFCDTGSIQWVKDNIKIFGLTTKDKIEFVDWNLDENSYQDLYLMSMCKHNIITQSSFGWWASWLNKNPNKITISPDVRINTTKWI